MRPGDAMDGAVQAAEGAVDMVTVSGQQRRRPESVMERRNGVGSKLRLPNIK